MNLMNGMWPAVVESYDGVARTCRVSLPGLTDGTGTQLEAVFCNPLGDAASTTEIRILPGDLVWVAFEAGDPRFPIITGYRTPRTGNPTGWRRWRHANIQLTAEDEFLIAVGSNSIHVDGAKVVVTSPDSEFSGNVKVGGNLQVMGSAVAAGNVSSTGGQVSDSVGTMGQIRSTFNSHNHNETNNVTGTPNQSM